MIYEWPKITKNLIITTNKHTENCDFLYQQLRENMWANKL